MPARRRSRSASKNRAEYTKIQVEEDMVEFQPVYVGKPTAVVGVIGEFYGPAGRTEREAQDRLLDYLQSDVGMKHFKDVYPDTDESKYQEVLFQLYEMDEKETFRNS
jgi:hypothetical protein